MSRRLPVFPLGVVPLPASALPLHIFEPRYRALMADLTGAELGTPVIDQELGIVGIERGHEVGGGEQRHRIGTLTRLVEAEQLPGGRWLALFAGTGRFSVDEWLPDDPYPLALVSDLPEPVWTEGDTPTLARLQERVLEVLALAAELGEAIPRPVPEWSSDPASAAWQVCALAPLGPFDRQQILEAPTVARRLDLLDDALLGAAEMFAFRLRDR